MQSNSMRILLIFFFFLVYISTIFSQDFQDIKVKGNFNEKLLSLVFLDWEINHRINFEYEDKLIDDIYIKASIPKLRLSKAMPLLLKDTELGYELIAPRTVRITENKNVKSIVEVTARTPTRTNFAASGKIKDKNTGESLPFASILLQHTTNGVSSNVDGYFTLFDVPNDTAVLEIQYLGYQTRLFRLTPDLDIENLEIELLDFSKNLQEVVVSATKEEQLLKASQGVSKIGFSPAQLDKLPSFGEKDIFRSLQLLPGISGSNESSSGLYVRGGTPDQNLILFDGFTVYHVDHLFGFFSAFNSNAIKDVQLHKGGFDAKFGGRLSSVVELTGKDGNTEQFNTGFGISLVSFNAFIESPFAKGKGSILLAGRRSFQSNFYNNLFESFTGGDENATQQPGFGRRGGQQQTSPNSYFYDLNAKVSYRPSSKDLVSFSFYNGQDDLDNSRSNDQNDFGPPRGGVEPDFTFERTATDLTQWGNWGASLKWSRKWSDRFYSNVNLSYSNYYSERDRSNNTTIIRDDSTTVRNAGTYEYNNLQDVTLKMDNEWKITSDNQLEFGAQLTYNSIDYNLIQNDTLTILNRADEGWTNSLYIQDRHTFGDKLIVKAGLRASQYSITNQVYFEPRASLSYLFSDRIKFKGAWGRYNQFATRIVREDIQQGSRDFWLLANGENIPTSFSEHFIGGVSYETPSFLFDVEAYYKNLDGLSEYSTRLTTSGMGPNRTLDYEELFYTGTGVAKGVEFLLQKKSGKFTGWLGYTLGSVKYDFDAFGDEPFSANQDQTHELKLVGNYTVGKLTLGATFIYASGKPYTSPTSFYEIELLDGTKSGYFEVSGKNALRLPDYHRFDVSATYDLNFGNTKGSIGVSIFNIYNRQNTWYKEYEVIEGELLETNVSLLNITPSLFFTWSLR